MKSFFFIWGRNHSSRNDSFLFRGGTAIKKVYFTDYRFSEDIDFLLREDQRFEICKKKFSEITEKINDDYPYGLNISLGESSQERLQLFIFYDIIPEIRSTKSLKVDISKDDVIPSYHRRKILFSYQQFKRNWEKRLRNQIANLPSYENVIKELERLIAEKFIRR